MGSQTQGFETQRRAFEFMIFPKGLQSVITYVQSAPFESDIFRVFGVRLRDRLQCLHTKPSQSQSLHGQPGRRHGSTTPDRR